MDQEGLSGPAGPTSVSPVGPAQRSTSEIGPAMDGWTTKEQEEFSNKFLELFRGGACPRDAPLPITDQNMDSVAQSQPPCVRSQNATEVDCDHMVNVAEDAADQAVAPPAAPEPAVQIQVAEGLAPAQIEARQNNNNEHKDDTNRRAQKANDSIIQAARETLTAKPTAIKQS